MPCQSPEWAALLAIRLNQLPVHYKDKRLERAPVNVGWGHYDAEQISLFPDLLFVVTLTSGTKSGKNENLAEQRASSTGTTSTAREMEENIHLLCSSFFF